MPSGKHPKSSGFSRREALRYLASASALPLVPTSLTNDLVRIAAGRSSDALALARETGDQERAQRYEQVVRGAARFVMQLQVKPEEAYFVRSPQDAVGGVRTTPALNLLRIDHVQHALVALIKARKVLYRDHD